jgi:hypothetical protein
MESHSLSYRVFGLALGGAMFAALPSSSSYQLHNYGFGSGGTSNSSSTNYSLNATTGQTTSGDQTSTTYKTRPGNQNTQQAHVPPAPTFTNANNYYNKLQLTINPDVNPSDTKFLVAISTDSFATTKYVQADGTIGAGKVYQTYAAWGGAGGQFITGLQSKTTYAAKVDAIEGSFTETEFGPTATAATVAPNISFGITVSTTYAVVAPPFTSSLGSLLPNSVVSAPKQVWVDFSTNGEAGGKIWVSSANAGLKSATANYTIASATADLAAASKGFGAQGTSVTQTSGGTFALVAPYNGSASNVGALTTGLQPVFTVPSPVTGGRGSFKLMAKSNSNVPAQSDYQDVLTLTAAAAF